MGAPKYASLRPDLLARKGEAAPAAPTASIIAAPAPNGSQPKGAGGPSTPPYQEDRTQLASRPIKGQVSATKASVRLRARHKRLLQFLKVARDLPQGEVIDRALEDYMRKLAIGEMRDCGCFMKAYLKKE